MPNKVFKLKSEYKPDGDQPKAIKDLLEGLKKGFRKQTLLGATGTGKTFTIANVIEEWGKPTLVIAHNKTLAAQLAQEFREFFPDAAVHYFVSYYDYYQPEAYMPVTDTYIEKDASINERIEQLRLKATSSLLSRKDVIVVASVSCIYGIGNPSEWMDTLVFLQAGKKYERNRLAGDLTAIKYERNDVGFKRGCFRLRGAAADIFPARAGYTGDKP